MHTPRSLSFLVIVLLSCFTACAMDQYPDDFYTDLIELWHTQHAPDVQALKSRSTAPGPVSVLIGHRRRNTLPVRIEVPEMAMLYKLVYDAANDTASLIKCSPRKNIPNQSSK